MPASVPGSSLLVGEEGEMEGEPGAGAPADLLVLPASSILAPQGLLREQGQLPTHPFLLCGGPWVQGGWGPSGHKISDPISQ